MLTLAVMLVLAATDAADRRVITIVEGRSAIVDLPFKPATGVNSNPRVVETRPDGKSLLLFGRARGQASYVVMDAKRARKIELEVNVVSADLDRIATDLRAQIGGDLED